MTVANADDRRQTLRGYWPRSSGPDGYVATLNFFACALNRRVPTSTLDGIGRRSPYATGARRPGSFRPEAEGRCSVVMVNRCRRTHHTVMCSMGPLVLSRTNRSVISAGARHCGQVTS